LIVSLSASRVRTFSQAAKNTAAAIIGMLALSGCAQPWSEEVDANAVACKGYGFYYGTPQYDACLRYIESHRAKRAAPSATPAPAQSPNVICQTRSSGATDCQVRQ
jgi:hypothetical protein